MTITAVLDFEMASVGPAELDLAWFLVLHRMTVERCRCDLAGFLDHDATVDAYEARLGRALAGLLWFEVFAALAQRRHHGARRRVCSPVSAWTTAGSRRGNPTVTLLAELISG